MTAAEQQRLYFGPGIWLEALRQHLAGRLQPGGAVMQIAANHRQMIDVYATAAAQP